MFLDIHPRNPLPICVYIIENYFRLTVTNFVFVSAFDGRRLETSQPNVWWIEPLALPSLQYHVALLPLQIGNILTYFLLQSCSNNNNRKPSASITISFFTNNFYFWKIDVSNIINKSIRFETNKWTLGTCLELGEVLCWEECREKCVIHCSYQKDISLSIPGH